MGKTLVLNDPGLPDEINDMAGWGLAAARPATGDVLAGSFYFSTDTNVLEQEQDDSWVAILQIKTLNPTNETVEAGYYAATTLSAIDAQLAAVNILSGVNIFGFVGVATVQDIADADLVIAQAPTGKKFYAVTGGVKTGTGTKTLNPANETVQAGYYEATTLSAVDVDLVVANIKSGITIFGKAGHTDVRDVSDANALAAEVKTGRTFYAVGGARKTGSGTKTLSAANEIVQAGYYAATTLSAVDADLIAANIKKGIVIFGITGTHKELIDYAIEATLAMFQSWPGIGTTTTPSNINDNDTGVPDMANAIGKYTEVPFGALVEIKRWRQFGHNNNNQDGVSKIEYWDVENAAWADWVTGISTISAGWSSLTTESIVVTTKIRFTATTIDSQGTSATGELEVYF